MSALLRREGNAYRSPSGIKAYPTCIFELKIFERLHHDEDMYRLLVSIPVLIRGDNQGQWDRSSELRDRKFFLLMVFQSTSHIRSSSC